MLCQLSRGRRASSAREEDGTLAEVQYQSQMQQRPRPHAMPFRKTLKFLESVVAFTSGEEAPYGGVPYRRLSLSLSLFS